MLIINCGILNLEKCLWNWKWELIKDEHPYTGFRRAHIWEKMKGMDERNAALQRTVAKWPYPDTSIYNILNSIPSRWYWISPDITNWFRLLAGMDTRRIFNLQSRKLTAKEATKIIIQNKDGTKSNCRPWYPAPGDKLSAEIGTISHTKMHQSLWHLSAILNEKNVPSTTWCWTTCTFV